MPPYGGSITNAIQHNKMWMQVTKVSSSAEQTVGIVASQQNWNQQDNSTSKMKPI